jgi:hypothetical protein
MSEKISSNSQFWIGVWSTVAASLILLLLTSGWQFFTEAFSGQPIKATITQVPAELGSELPINSATARDLAEAIRSATVPVSDPRPMYLETQRRDLFARAKEPLASLTEFVGREPHAVQVIRIHNDGKKVISSIKVTVKDALRIVVQSDNEKYQTLKSGDVVNFDRIEPQETKLIFVWRIFAASLKYSPNVRIIAGDEAVAVTEGNTTDILAQMIDQFGIMFFFGACLLFLGALVLVIGPVAAFIQSKPELRRKYVKKEEFDRMLGDIIELYPKFRPASPNPFHVNPNASSEIAHDPGAKPNS